MILAVRHVTVAGGVERQVAAPAASSGYASAQGLEGIAMAASHAVEASDLDRQSQLQRLMVRWRQRLRPQDVPKLVHGGRARRRNYVSQEDMAALTGVTTAWYGALERGQLRNYSDEFLDRVAESLRLNSGSGASFTGLSSSRSPRRRAGSAFRLSCSR
jgi:DNA-binding XRE family transcriptional regulator